MGAAGDAVPHPRPGRQGDPRHRRPDRRRRGDAAALGRHRHRRLRCHRATGLASLGLPGRATSTGGTGIDRAAGPGGRRDLGRGPRARGAGPAGAHPASARRCWQRDPDALLAVAGSLLAPAASVGRFGSDLTVMVAGSPSAAVSALLDSCADRESRGAAVVWRFSPASVRRALDEGVGADELVACTSRDRRGRSAAAADVPDRRCAAPARVPGRPAGAELRALGRRGIADRGRRPPQPALAASFAAGADGAGVPGRARRRARRPAGRRVPAGSGRRFGVVEAGSSNAAARCRPIDRCRESPERMVDQFAGVGLSVAYRPSGEVAGRRPRAGRGDPVRGSAAGPAPTERGSHPSREA